MIRSLLRISAISAALALTSVADSGYVAEEVNGPEGVTLEVGDLAFMPDGSLMLCTRRGNVWNLKDGKWTRFAMGLQEPLGLVPGDKPGEIYVLQRPELTRLVDENGDGVADLYHSFAKGWGFSANYHEYAMAFARDKQGNFFGGLGLPYSHKKNNPYEGQWLGTMDVKDRGWYFRISKDGKYEPWAPGVREPVGAVINDAGDVFVTDTQGSFTCSNWVIHVEKGDFLGHPDAFFWDENLAERNQTWKKMPAAERNKAFNKLRKRPVAYIPYRTMGNSVGGCTFDTTDGKFGPFAGQMIVGEINQPLINRVAMEKIDGQYQGAVFQLHRGNDLAAGNHKFAFDKDGTLYVGQTARGWGRGQGLKRMRFTGKVPFDVKTINLEKDGFTLHFTKPAKADGLAKLAFKRTEYEYTNGYTAKMLHGTNLEVSSAKLADDGMSARVVLNGLEPDRVIEVDYRGMVGVDGTTTTFGRAWYTLNKLK
jgi:glucose/arabinose dehydrogenase